MLPTSSRCIAEAAFRPGERNLAVQLHEKYSRGEEYVNEAAMLICWHFLGFDMLKTDKCDGNELVRPL
jgi:hypothetical protein